MSSAAVTNASMRSLATLRLGLTIRSRSGEARRSTRSVHGEHAGAG